MHLVRLFIQEGNLGSEEASSLFRSGIDTWVRRTTLLVGKLKLNTDGARKTSLGMASVVVLFFTTMGVGFLVL